MKIKHIDNSREFDWGNTSKDYSQYRKGYPKFVWDYLAGIGIGTPNQRILDLGTGTGELARNFAKNGAVVTGVDIASEQIAAAKKMSDSDNVKINFFSESIENCEFESNSFDIVSAGQCWLYFDSGVLLPKLEKWLIPRGKILLMHFNWLPFEDKIAKQTEDLVLKYNPDWKGAHFKENRNGHTFKCFSDYSLLTFQKFIEPIPYDYESWRGRIRACRGVAASLPIESVKKFDNELQELLSNITSEKFNILHEISIHVFRISD